MKFCYEIFPDKHLIVQKFTGSFSLSDLISCAEQLWADPRYSRNFDGIADIGSGSVSVSLCDLYAFIGFLTRHNSISQGRWAAVVSTPLAIACGMIYKRAMIDKHPFEIFPTWNAAYTFLKVELVPTVLACLEKNGSEEGTSQGALLRANPDLTRASIAPSNCNELKKTQLNYRGTENTEADFWTECTK